MNAKRPIICLGAIDWSYLFQRPQQLMLCLARQGHPVHYRNPAQMHGIPPEEIAPNLWVYKDFDYVPKEIMDYAIYIIYFPAHAAWIDPGNDKFVIYDCCDDDPAFDGHEELMLNRADLVVCCSNQLLKKHQGKHQHLMLLTNGVDMDNYSSGGEEVPLEMAAIKATGKSVIGFIGAFHTGWVDAELLYYLAVHHSQWQYVIIGTNYEWNFDDGMHKAPPNLHYLGPRPYQTLPEYMKAFDVGIIPFLDNKIARGADPLKLYEYLAAGLPIVSRDLPFIKGLNPPLVYRYTSNEECVNAIQQALSDQREKTGEKQKLRREYAANFTWESRVDLLLKKLQELTWLER